MTFDPDAAPLRDKYLKLRGDMPEDPNAKPDLNLMEATVTTGSAPICYSCIHKGKDLTCDAFPDRIPIPILYNEADHRKEYKGDHGIQFEQNESSPAPLSSVLEVLDGIEST